MGLTYGIGIHYIYYIIKSAVAYAKVLRSFLK